MADSDTNIRYLKKADTDTFAKNPKIIIFIIFGVK